MNILFLEGDMSRHGGTERMTALLSSMLARNHSVSVISLRLDGGKVYFQLAEGVRHSIIGAKRTCAKLKYIRRFIRKNSIDTVINVDTGMGYIGILAAKGTDAKVVTWEHSNFYNDWNSGIFPHLRRFAAQKSDAVVVLTSRDKHNYEKNIKKCAPVSVIPNPAKSRDYCYALGSKTILSAGILGKIKRFELIIPIGKVVFAKHPDWEWVICGDGPERESLENAVNEAGLGKNIIFRGSVSDMNAEYAAAAMYVLTSEMEGLPMVLLEAKSYGLPIVSFDIETGPSDIVRDGINGYLVESGNTDEIAEKICTLIENSSLRMEFSRNASLDMEKFDEEMIVKKWETLIRGL